MKHFSWKIYWAQTSFFWRVKRWPPKISSSTGKTSILPIKNIIRKISSGMTWPSSLMCGTMWVPGARCFQRKIWRSSNSRMICHTTTRTGTGMTSTGRWQNLLWRNCSSDSRNWGKNCLENEGLRAWLHDSLAHEVVYNQWGDKREAVLHVFWTQWDC